MLFNSVSRNVTATYWFSTITITTAYNLNSNNNNRHHHHHKKPLNVRLCDGRRHAAFLISPPPSANSVTIQNPNVYKIYSIFRNIIGNTLIVVEMLFYSMKFWYFSDMAFSWSNIAHARKEGRCALSFYIDKFLKII